MVRMRLIWVGEPAVVMPARLQILLGVSFSVVRTRLGSSRSSKKMSRISSSRHREFEIVLALAGIGGLLAALPPSPDCGFLISSPGVNSLLPGSTKSCSPRGLRIEAEARLLACPWSKS